MIDHYEMWLNPGIGYNPRGVVMHGDRLIQWEMGSNREVQ